jgi:colanic acid biosynthesis glycosyl transferase WcaI
MSHVLFVTPYYPPEVGAPQTRISETAVRLVQRGHQVTVLTTLPNYPSGQVPPEYQRGQRRREERDGVAVVRVWSYIRPNKGFFNRILAQLSFGCLAPFLGGRAVGRPDIIIVESPPLFDAIAGRILSRWKRCPFVFTVADMWPEAAVQMGLLRNRLAIWLAERLEWSAYRRAAAVWAVTEGLRRLFIQRGLAPQHVFTVSNGVDTAKFRPMPRDGARAALGWGDAFIVLFAGTIGLAPGLMTLLDAAQQLRDQAGIRIVLLGDGAARDDLIVEAARCNLNNVVFLDPLPHDQLPLAIAAADVCFAGLRPLPLFEGTMPVKCYEAMACARPILLAAADGLARQLCVDEAGAAIAVAPGDAAAIANGICYLRDHPDIARELGRRGRAYVTAHFDREQLTTALETHLAELIAGQRAAAAEPVPLTAAAGGLRAHGDRG